MTYNCVCWQDFYGQEELPTSSQVALSIITIIGLSLSIAGLSATVLSFLCIKQVYCDSFAAAWITALVTDMTAATGFAITTDSVVMKSLHVSVTDPHEDQKCTQRAFGYIHRISETGCCCRVSATHLVGSLLFLFRLGVILRINFCLGGNWFVVDWSDCLGWSNYCTVNRPV